MYYEKYISKDHLRLVFYGIAVLFIAYFFWDTAQLCADLDKPLVKDDNNEINILNYTYKETNITHLSNTQGQLIWSIFINIMQILFLVMFMLMLYIGERLEKWNSKL